MSDASTTQFREDSPRRVLKRPLGRFVRYVGWYSNRIRGERATEASPHAGGALSYAKRVTKHRVRCPCEGYMGAAHP